MIKYKKQHTSNDVFNLNILSAKSSSDGNSENKMYSLNGNDRIKVINKQTMLDIQIDAKSDG